MASQFDDTDFIDREFQQSQQTALTGSLKEMRESTPAQPTSALPTRQELEAKVGDTHLRLLQLKRQQEELEQQRVALEETRRRRKEFHDGKSEMVQHLTRGIALLEEAELSVRRDATQMGKALVDFREALEKISAFSEESWTAENVEVELTRALTAIENARMEWNAARIKWSFLNGKEMSTAAGDQRAKGQSSNLVSMAGLSFGQLCRLGFALTWPLVLIGLLTVGVLAWRIF
ncbi:MAG: hypothetical protein M2R45_03898 [Verrucomicrobia subdivision 3 bacterium]|nr:hypothetical protein [Limisphaerales bacterium]MCS1412601.1 hypothetical protein [Limisphaerales bacterium]